MKIADTGRTTATTSNAVGERRAADLLARFREVRRSTLALAAPLSDEDCAVQSMTEASPVKWNLGHTSWFYETFVLSTDDR